jgi:hypothetical protein
VAEVASVGGMVKQYQVIVDPARLRAFRLTLEQVRLAIENANHETGGSVIEMAEAEYMVRVHGYIQGEKDLRAVPLGVTSSGAPIRWSTSRTSASVRKRARDSGTRRQWRSGRRHHRHAPWRTHRTINQSNQAGKLRKPACGGKSYRPTIARPSSSAP